MKTERQWQELSTGRPAPANIHRAVDSDGRLVYLVGVYAGGRYTTAMDRHERRLSGGAAWFGPFGWHRRRIYRSEGGARYAAGRLYGYGKITDAAGPFESPYRAIDRQRKPAIT